MNLLLDTHVLLWWLDDDPTMSTSAYEAIADGHNLVLISAASVWEIVIKQSLNKIQLPDNFQDVLLSQPFHLLNVRVEHVFRVGRLPILHRDPFDRILIAQSQVEGLTLVTRDKMISQYEVPCLQA